MADRTIVLAQNKRHAVRGVTVVNPQEFSAYQEDHDDLTYIVDMSSYLDGATISSVTRTPTGVTVSNTSNTTTRLTQRLKGFGYVDINVTSSSGEVEQFRITIQPRGNGAFFLSSTGSVPQNTAQFYNIVQNVTEANIDSGIDWVRTSGYYTVGDGGDALYKRVSAAPSHGAYITSNSGATYWELAGAVLKADAAGAKGDGTTTDTTALTSLFSKLSAEGGGVAIVDPLSVTTHSNEENDNVKALTLNNSRAGLTRFQIGTKATPVPDSLNPAVVIQKFTKYDADGAPSSHQVGGLFAELYQKGSGVSGSSDIEGTWIGLAGNAHQEGTNHGTSSSQDWDAVGNIVGVAGFASAEGFPGTGRIITALWGYASTPNVDQTTITNAAGAFVTCGLEININQRHADQGAQTVVAQKGDVVGQYIYNYRAPSEGVRSWTFGIAFNGSPDDGNFSSTDPTNWSGFHTGMLVDKIKSAGILFGQYFQNTAYGLKFPTSYGSSAMRPAAAMFLGDNQINMATDFTGTAASGDLWQSGGFLNFTYSSVNERVLTERSAAVRFASTTTLDFQVNSLTTLRLGTVASAVNRFSMFPAATGGAPALVATGTDTNIPFEFRSTGTGRQFFTISSAEQFEITSTASAVNKLSVTGAATGNAPALSAVGSNTDIDLALAPKGAGLVKFGTHSALGVEVPSGFITIKDSGGTSRKIMVCA